MQWRYNLTHFLLVSVVVLGLMPLMVCVDVQAQIAFASSKGGSMEIYVMDADGNNPRRLTNNRHRDLNPSWSPDGKRIAFASKRDGNWEIYVMDADGGNQQNLTNNPRSDSSPSWSPDGKHIAFASDRDGDLLHFNIYVMDADGKNQQRLTNNRQNDQYPSWSPDGKRIVFSARKDGHFRGDFEITSELYVMDADGKNQQRLTNNRQNDQYPSWSPDGKRIVFASDRKGNWRNFDIYVMDADGKNQQRLTENRSHDSKPSWSPDSKKILFHSRRDGNMELYVMDTDGGNLQNLTNNPLHTDIGPAWLNSPFAVAPTGKKFTMWGRLKQINR